MEILKNLIAKIDDKNFSSVFKALALLFLLIQLGIILLLILFFFVRGKEAGEKSGSGKGKKKITVNVLYLKPEKVIDYLEIPGIIESWATIKISAEVEGSIVEIGAEKGHKVDKGQLLLRIDDRIYSARKKMEGAGLSHSELNLARVKKLFESKSVSEREYEDAQNVKTVAEAEFSIAETNLAKCRIVSPVVGILDKRPVELGEHVQIGRHVATVVQVDRVKLLFALPEKEISFVKTGKTIDFTLDCYPGKVFKGKVIYIATAAEKTSLSFPVELEIVNPEMNLRPGMICSVKIVRRAIDNALSVPLIAIIPRYGEHYVFLSDNNSAALRKVEIAFINGSDAVISRGLAAGDRVVIEGQRFLNEGDELDMVGE